MSGFVVDTSVFVAIAQAEAGSAEFENALMTGGWLIGWPTFLELRIWLLRNPGVIAEKLIDAIQTEPTAHFVDFDRALEGLAADAYARFGKGRHPAKLNYGDCMTYAVARHHDVPLLFKGADFGLTDVKLHPASVIVA